MTLAKIVVTGKVVKTPEKRFTQNNLAVTSLIIDIHPQDETLVRVSAIGSLADRIGDSIVMGDNIIVDGRLQMDTVKTSSGRERKVAAIVASTVEKISVTESYSRLQQTQDAPVQKAPAQNNTDSVVQFSSDEIAEDLIDPDEIPF